MNMNTQLPNLIEVGKECCRLPINQELRIYGDPLNEALILCLRCKESYCIPPKVSFKVRLQFENSIIKDVKKIYVKHGSPEKKFFTQ